ncbi:hypothetical protein FXO38_06748 [Capsicum annuum]|nr:hypothetical protein FXO38_06748 [Capsicum annuum]
MNTFRYIRDLCGGFIGIDEDTKSRVHLFWARICVKASATETPSEAVLVLGDLRFGISIVEDKLVDLKVAEDGAPVAGDGATVATMTERDTGLDKASSSQVKDLSQYPPVYSKEYRGSKNFNSNKCPVEPNLKTK